MFDDNSPRASENLKHITLPLVLTPLLETEVANAFQLRIFRRESDENQIRTSFELFAKDLRAGVFDPRSFTTEIFRLASQISGRSTPTFGRRTLDLLHVASAVFLRSEKFYTFDKKQAELARSEGLVVFGGG